MLKRWARTLSGLSPDMSPPGPLRLRPRGSGASMLVLGAWVTGAFGWMALGSVSRYAAAHASRPVVIVRGQTAPVHRQAGIGIGDLDAWADSLTFALEGASVRRASLIAVHALHMSGISRPWSPSWALDLAAVEADTARQLAGLLVSRKARWASAT